MSHIKGNSEQQKAKIYQTKTVSDKNIPSGKNDLTHILHLNKLIEQSSPKDLLLFIEKETPSQYAIKTVVNELIKKYDTKNENFYKILDILLQAGGGNPNYMLNFVDNEHPKNLEKDDEITLLMFAVIMQDIEMVKIVLKYDKEVNTQNQSGKTALVYDILYNKNDDISILNLLIEHNANVNQVFKLEINPNKFEYYSVFTLACHKDLPKHLKVLIDNHVDVNYQTSITLDTGLHICAKEGRENCLKVLLNCDRIHPKLINKEEKTAHEIIPDNEKKKQKEKEEEGGKIEAQDEDEGLGFRVPKEGTEIKKFYNRIKNKKKDKSEKKNGMIEAPTNSINSNSEETDGNSALKMNGNGGKNEGKNNIVDQTNQDTTFNISNQNNNDNDKNSNINNDDILGYKRINKLNESLNKNQTNPSNDTQSVNPHNDEIDPYSKDAKEEEKQSEIEKNNQFILTTSQNNSSQFNVPKEQSEDNNKPPEETNDNDNNLIKFKKKKKKKNPPNPPPKDYSNADNNKNPPSGNQSDREDLNKKMKIQKKKNQKKISRHLKQQIPTKMSLISLV